ncbi:hypothetical protein J437_LFUL011257 [Ladona fulva]|uniref:Trafficking protein particle complex subunit 8 n=1 Tax=Ladona fulva TaxID=123851 RepID=A0A8K0P4Z0_LADFU|nr:hypothetical protein J437_LFUL011257 [Ladona fulva]
MKNSPQEFIQKTFSPMVAVISSTAAENVCQKNNLSFIDLLRPFSRLTCEAQFRDPSGASIPVRGLQLCFRQVDHVPPPPPLARRMLDDAVASTPPSLPSNLRNSDDPNREEDVVDETHFPWFELWREEIGFLVVSSVEEEISTVERLNSLWKEVQKLSSKTTGGPKWFFTNSILKYCVVLHDESSSEPQRAEAAFSEVKCVFGVGCHLLRINSRKLNGNANDNEENGVIDYWVPYLPAQNVENAEDLLLFKEEVHDPASDSIPMQKDSIPEIGEEASPDVDKDDTDTSSIPSLSYVVQDHPLSPETEKVSMAGMNEDSENSSTKRYGSIRKNQAVMRGAHLSNADIENIKAMINDFCTRSFIPHAERLMQILHEGISNRKGMSRSLFSATKRWFGGNRPGLQGPPVPSISYASDAPELQLRRLADLCFLLGHYSVASDAYRSAKRDFAADGAWTHFAGALEMAGLAAYLHWNSPGLSQSDPTGSSAQGVGPLGAVVGGGPSSLEAAKKAIEYFDQSVLTYLNTCRMYNLATRATLLASEVLLTPWAGSKHGEAAASLVRLAGEDSDLRSALLLERASLCLLSFRQPLQTSVKLKTSSTNALQSLSPGQETAPVTPNNLTLALSASSKALPRKAALHAVLAGHRYSKAGHRPHALRCYAQAYKVYEGKGWRLAEDHIHFAMGRLASHLKRPENAAHSFSLLLSPSLNPPFYVSAFTPSPTTNQPVSPSASGPVLIPTRNQPPSQQAIFLKEFLNAQIQLKMKDTENSEKKSLPVLPIPTIEQGSVRVLLGSSPSLPDTHQQINDRVQLASGVGFGSKVEEDGNIGWAKLEENLLLAAQGSVPMLFMPTVQLYSDTTDNSISPIGVMGEPVLVQIRLCNPLGIPLPLSDIRLLWMHTPQSDSKPPTEKSSTSSDDNTSLKDEGCKGNGEGVVARTQVLPSIILAPTSNQEVVLSITPLCMGELRIQGIAFRLSNPTPGMQDTSKLSSSDSSSGNLMVEAKSPEKLWDIAMSVAFKGLPTELVGGEIRSCHIELRNVGLRSLPLRSLFVATPSPNTFCFGLNSSHADKRNAVKTGDVTLAKWRNSPVNNELGKDNVRPLPPGVWKLGTNSIAKRDGGEMLDKDSLLGPGQGLIVPMWVRGPEGQGEKSVSLSLLFYYEAADELHVGTSEIQKGSFQRSPRRPCHRLVRHSWKVEMLDAVELRGRGGGSIGEVLPGCGSSPQSLSLTLNLKNCSPSTVRPGVGMVSEVNLLRASLASLHWAFAPKKPILPVEVKLGAQESVNLLFKAHRSEDNNPNEESILFSDVLLDETMNSGVSLDPHTQHWALPAMPFSYQSRIGEEGKTGKSSSDIGDDDRAEEATITSSAESSMPTRLDATLILRWKALVKWNTMSDGAESMTKEHWAFGQHQVSIDALSLTPGSNHSILGGGVSWSQSTLHSLPNSVSQMTPLEVLQRLVTHSIFHPPRVIHDFSHSRLCLVPVKLILQNCSNYHLVVEVQTSSLGGYPANKNQLYSPHPSGQFLWVGRISAMVNLLPHASSQEAITLTAAFPAPGTYNLASRLSVSCRQCIDKKDKDVMLSLDKPNTLESEKATLEGSIELGSKDLRTHLGKDAVTQVWRVESAVVVVGA